jgi:hypothetical protein
LKFVHFGKFKADKIESQCSAEPDELDPEGVSLVDGSLSVRQFKSE